MAAKVQKLPARRRAALKEQGFSEKDIRDIESTLASGDEDDDRDDRGRRSDRSDKPRSGGSRKRGSGPGRVTVLEGDQADRFLDRIFGDGADDDRDRDRGRDDDKGGKDDADTDDDAEDEDEDDDKPKTGPRWFE